jgi:hypothetical protein
MPEAWSPDTHKSNEISGDGVFAEHGIRSPDLILQFSDFFLFLSSLLLTSICHPFRLRSVRLLYNLALFNGTSDHFSQASAGKQDGTQIIDSEEDRAPHTCQAVSNSPCGIHVA